MAGNADDCDPRLAGVEAAIAEHRSLYLRAVDAGHDGEAQHHEDRVDTLLDTWRRLRDNTRFAAITGEPVPEGSP